MRLVGALLILVATLVTARAGGPPPCVEEPDGAARLACLRAAADAATAEADRAALALATGLAGVGLDGVGLDGGSAPLAQRIETAQSRWRAAVDRACGSLAAPEAAFARLMRQLCRLHLAEARAWRLGRIPGSPAVGPYLRVRPGAGGRFEGPEVLLDLPAWTD